MTLRVDALACRCYLPGSLTAITITSRTDFPYANGSPTNMGATYRIDQSRGREQQAYVEITRQDFDSVVEANAGLFVILGLEELYDVLLANHITFEETLLSAAAQRLMNRPMTFDSDRRAAHRGLANVLSSARAFIDQSARMIAGLSRTGPADAERLKAFLSEAYDASLGFRVMEALRNYTQHRGFSVSGVTYQDRMITHRPLKTAVTVIPNISIATLEADSTFKKTVLSELKAAAAKEHPHDPSQRDRLQVIPFAREYIAGLSMVMEQVRSHLSGREAAWSSLVEGMVSRHGTQSGLDKSEGYITLQQVDPGGVVTEKYANTRVIQMIAELRSINRPLSRLTIQSISQ